MENKSSIKGIIVMIVASFITATGQLLWKLFQLENSLLYLILGFSLYGIGAILMIIAFKYGKYSAVHPMMCTSYIFALGYSSIFLSEKINLIQVIGVLVIIFGVFLIGRENE